MEGLALFNVIIWTVCGVINLASKEISKFSYGIMWIVLMMYLVDRCFMV